MHSKLPKHLQPCKFDTTAAIATFALGANLVEIYFFVLWHIYKKFRNLFGFFVAEIKIICRKF